MVECGLAGATAVGWVTTPAHPIGRNAYDHNFPVDRPGGLQLGHLMNEAGRDYVIFEQAATAGSFFKEYPRHRKLISLNKRITGRRETTPFFFFFFFLPLLHDHTSATTHAHVRHC